MPLSLNLQPARKNTRRYPATPWSEQRLYRPFVRWALLIGIIFGFATGAGMLLIRVFDVPLGMWWVTHAQSHGVAQIFGFAGLFTMGIAFHVIPRFRNGPMRFPLPQRVVLVSMVIGIVMRFVGQSISGHPAISSPLVVASGVLMLFSITCFATAGGVALAKGATRRGPAERWLAAGIAWLVVAGVIQLAISVRMAAGASVVAHGEWNSALIPVGLLGFIGCFIFGVSTRTVTGFLGLRQQQRRLELAAFALFNVGVGWLAVASLTGSPAKVAGIGSLAVAVGAGVFVLALRVLEPSSIRRPVMPGAYPRYSWFVRAAYAWVIVYAGLTLVEAAEVLASAAILPGPDARPTIHVLTLGFITSMIIGMSTRMIPLFEGSVIRGHRLLDAVWVLLTISVSVRLVFGFTRPGAEMWLAVSGVLGLLAICVYAALLLGSITRKSRDRYRKAAAEIGRVRWTAVTS